MMGAASDSDNYQPNQATRATLKNVRLVGVVGVSGAGKTTLIHKTIEKYPTQFRMVIGTTSRAPRQGETDGIDYNFERVDDMESRIAARDYVQIVHSPMGDWYATRPEDYSQSGHSLLALFASVVPEFRALPFADMVTIGVIPPSFEEWRSRIAAHRLMPEKLQARMREAQTSLEFLLDDQQTYLVTNDDLGRAFNDFMRAAQGKPQPKAQQEAAKKVISDLLQNIKKSLKT